MTTYAVHTLGCKLNYAETDTIARELSKIGFQRVSFSECADIFILNTCCVTENADKECLKIVRKLKKQYPNSVTVLTGCLAQVQQEKLRKLDCVDLVLGVAEKFHLPSYLLNLRDNQSSLAHNCEASQSLIPNPILSFKQAYSIEQRTRAFLKVQDGCNYSCTYCVIPQARGMSRSADIQEVVRNAQEIARHGIQEIVLTGVNIGEFGSENGRRNLLELLQALISQTQIPRFRISSIEPNLLSDNILEFVAREPRFMPHFHIPLQSGCDKILRLMKRRYNTKIYAQKIQQVHSFFPEAAIGIDVMVGFPGELDADFQDSFDFISQLPISYIHAFTYSERPNTPASNYSSVVPVATRKIRNAQLRALSAEKSQIFKNTFLGTARKVLFEQPKENIIEGYSDNYIRIQARYEPGMENQILSWNIG